jgi:hypothetical protein
MPKLRSTARFAWARAMRVLATRATDGEELARVAGGRGPWGRVASRRQRRNSGSPGRGALRGSHGPASFAISHLSRCAGVFQARFTRCVASGASGVNNPLL